MKDWYFYQDHGKTVGPFNVDDIKGRIKDGRLRVFDLIYKDGEPSWRMALEHSALRSEFMTSTMSTLKDRPWICLQKKSLESLDFVTSGPFTHDEIREKILSGKISYSDYAWKDSFSEWKRIGSLEEFNPRTRNVVLPPVPSVPEETVTDLLRNVVELQRAAPPQVEALPPEADSDFASPPPVPSADLPAHNLKKMRSKREQEPRIESSPLVPASPPPSSAPTSPIRIHSGSKQESKRKHKSRSQPWLDWSLVGVLVLVLAGIVLIVSRFALPHAGTPGPENPPVATERQPLPVNALPAIVEKPEVAPVTAAAPLSIPSKAPSKLSLTVQSGGAGPPKIDLRTDGSTEFPLYLQIIGLPGQVAEGGAYYRFMRLTPNGNMQQPLDIPALKLPQGKYILRAEAGELKKETKFTWGTGETQYKQAISKQRKAWAHAIWKERLALFRLSEVLEKQVSTAIIPTKKFSSKGWEPLIALKRNNGANYFLFDDWWELHSIAKEAKVGVNGPLVSRAQKERERLSTFSVWK